MEIEEFIEQFQEMRTNVERIMTALGIKSQVLTIKDLAQRYQCSYNKIKYSHPYLMPNNGKSDFGGGTIKWYIKTVEDWENIPIAERKRNWEQEQMNKARRKLG